MTKKMTVADLERRLSYAWRTGRRADFQKAIKDFKSDVKDIACWCKSPDCEDGRTMIKQILGEET